MLRTLHGRQCAPARGLSTAAAAAAASPTMRAVRVHTPGSREALVLDGLMASEEDACVVENDACADDEKSSLLDALFAAPSLDDLDDEEPPPLV